MLAKNAGHKAYYSKVNTNPHPVGTVNHTYWRKAWLAAQADFNKRLARKGIPARCKRVIVNTESNGFLSPTLRTTQPQPEVQSLSAGKGKQGQNCNVTACQAPNSANHYNTAMQAWYCRRCATDIEHWANVDGNSFFSDLVEAPPAPTAHNSGNPQGKLLASTSGLIRALKTFRETDKSYYVTYYGEGGKEIRISKDDPRRRIFDTMEAAEAWAMGESK